MTTNNPPKIQWFRFDLSNGIVRSQLHVNGCGTAYFIDEAKTIGHRCCGERFGLYGSGMGAKIRRHDGTTYQIAAPLDFGPKIGPLKARAERFATEG